jgi:hypothetical protein
MTVAASLQQIQSAQRLLHFQDCFTLKIARSANASDMREKRCVFRPNSPQKLDFPVISRGQISPCGRMRAGSFSSGVDFKRVKNDLQGFKGNLYPSGV